MKGIRLVAVTGLLSLALAGCMSSGPKQKEGTVATANRAIPSAAASLGGGTLGNAIGEELAADDRRVALEAEYRALEYGRAGAAVQWRGNGGRSHGAVVAGARYQVNDFSCRDITHTIYIGEAPQIARGTACRQPDGTWKAVG